ncbi:FMN-binding negative transcriptional regulator [Xenorhabdus bovienii]|uniref:FMN-binding negative transcriptional regulator n=1 Tax=Xenorhabdus bovienii TaxID=40576 RepID=UPI00237C929F|nr:FMN-binding negative transcriptional regulator [Xenorhabdus bovienii]MDE1497303.1 FMN-binding negative transcriptional regulator [Xenorhabdus bovienii]
MSHCPFHYDEYRSLDNDLIARFIDVFPLALITCQSNTGVIASHLPLFRNTDNSLFGHADRHNPLLRDGIIFEAHIVFMGPSAYIPPEAYINKQLPTWNYVAVHMTAKVQPIDNEEENFTILQQTSRYLAREENSFIPERDDPRVVRNLPGICGIRLVPSHVEGRFKLSQDKSPEDRAAALAWLMCKPRAEENKLLQSLLDI